MFSINERNKHILNNMLIVHNIHNIKHILNNILIIRNILNIEDILHYILKYHSSYTVV